MMATAVATTVTHSQVAGSRSPGNGWPRTTTPPTEAVSTMAQNASAVCMWRFAAHAENSSVSMSESARTGCTTSREPNASAAAWKPYATNARPIDAHQAGCLIERIGESLFSPSGAPARMMRWRHTVPAAMVAAETSANATARKLLCTVNDINAGVHFGSFGTLFLTVGMHADPRRFEMALIVQKYGGSSLESAERIRAVAQRVVETRRAGNDVVVVCSAMGDTTDELLDLAEQVNPTPPAREMDMLLTAGERISNSLVAMAVHALGEEVQSFTGSQAGVITTERHGNARILEVTPGRVQEAVDAGKIAIVAGFQGVNRETKDVTTLGRGGSDTTAVALAAAMGADECEIYSDVDGVYTADPRIVPDAKKLDTLCFEEMLELAASGSKILVLRSVEYARAFNVPLRVRSSYSTETGTLVAGALEDIPMEEAVLTGVATDASEAKITILGITDSVGEAAKVFRALSDAEVNIDMVIQNISSAEDNKTDITFTLPKADGARTMELLRTMQAAEGWDDLTYDDEIGKVSLVGAGMKSHPGVTADFCDALRDAGINIEMITTSEIRITAVVRQADVAEAARAIHTKFDLGGDEPAVVYAGTGR